MNPCDAYQPDFAGRQKGKIRNLRLWHDSPNFILLLLAAGFQRMKRWKKQCVSGPDIITVRQNTTEKFAVVTPLISDETCPEVFK